MYGYVLAGVMLTTFLGVILGGILRNLRCTRCKRWTMRSTGRVSKSGGRREMTCKACRQSAWRDTGGSFDTGPGAGP